jgi:hypothetical protein
VRHQPPDDGQVLDDPDVGEEVPDQLVRLPVIAAPSGSGFVRSGTWSTIRYADKQMKRATILFPDGTTRMIRSSSLPEG